MQGMHRLARCCINTKVHVPAQACSSLQARQRKRMVEVSKSSARGMRIE